LAPQSGQSSRAQPKVKKGNASNGAASYAQQLRRKLKGLDGGRGIIKTELQKYLNERLEEDEVGDDVLAWWKVYGPRYHVVARIARDVLVVPVSTLASESVFSARGHGTLDSFRTSLTSKVID